MTDLEKRRAQLRANAEMNFYASERRSGTPPEVAYDRAQEFLKRFEGEINELAT